MSGPLRRYADAALEKILLGAVALCFGLAGLLYGAFALYRYAALQWGDVPAAASLSIGQLACAAIVGAVAFYRRAAAPTSEPRPLPATTDALLAQLVADCAPNTPFARVGLALLAGLLAGARAPKN
ncbi:MAG: hypothetical protein ING44_19540 [Telmatospirillum sp.]|nr:hypothetical protein [Telmatospirillum sp.]